jgi:hypothetical protein
MEEIDVTMFRVLKQYAFLNALIAIPHTMDFSA